MAMISNQRIFLRRWIGKLFHPPTESPEYRAWKQKLFRDRLIVCFWLMLLCVVAFAVKDFIEVYHPENARRILEYSVRSRLELYRARTIYPYITIATTWIVCWYRLKKDRFRHHTWAIFLAITWSQTVYLPIVGTFIGEPYLGDIFYLGLIFLSLAILIPVRWRIHSIAQLGSIVYYFGIMPILGWLGLIEIEFILPLRSRSISAFFLSLFDWHYGNSNVRKIATETI
ncbi:MAG: hypothetical protein AAGE84_19035 [Cyanobacteria bacterium P01_G01_bin.39]